uniref:Fibronectin-binding protein n=1 Tax=Streptococcus dysgalactiae subsp. equisimilis TaxID=119602 RepID=Q54099_STREQ|nr:fibronectin-binding protein [Streptococcus dysgalactiae subsp. equisimilis]
MKNKVLKTLVLFLFAVLGIFAMQTVEAEGRDVSNEVVTRLDFDKTEIPDGGVFRTQVEFKVKDSLHLSYGDYFELKFEGPDSSFNLEKPSIPLKDTKTQNILGEVKFDNKSKTIRAIFTNGVKNLHNVEGGFYFDLFARNTNQRDESVKLKVISGTKHAEVVIQKERGGTATDNIYYKSGDIPDTQNEDSVRWSFTFNAARKSTNGVGFLVTDTLDSTMTWDVEKNLREKYAINFTGGWIGDELLKSKNGWLSLKEAENYGIKVEFSGQTVSINIPEKIQYDNGSYQELNESEMQIHLYAKIKKEVLENSSIEYVRNESKVEVRGENWPIDPNSTSAYVQILRQGGWAKGTVRGEVRILKIIEGTEIGIEGVEFEIKSKITGKVWKIITNQLGIACQKGLPEGQYELKEVRAPEWIEFDPFDSQKYSFEVKDSDLEGKIFKITNKKRKVPLSEKVNLSVTKIWDDYNNKFKKRPTHLFLTLLESGKPVMGKTDIIVYPNGDNWNYAFENLPKFNSEGKVNNYSVLETQANDYEIPIIEEISPYNFTITNRYINKETTKFSGKKIWKNDRADQRPESIQVQLLQDKVPIKDKIKTVTKANDWSYTFVDLPKYDETGKEYKYSVEEVTVPDGYKVSYLGNDIYNTRETEFIFENNNFSLEFGNSEVRGQSGSKVITENTLTSFKGRKLWKNDAAADRPEDIQVQLYADGVAIEDQKKYVSGSGDEWSFEFKNLKKYGKSGKEITYSVKEVTVPAGYDVTYSGNDIINTKREVITQHGPILGLDETLPTEEHESGGTTTIEDSRPIDTMSGLSGETGQSGNTTIEEDSTTHVKFSKHDINGKELAGAMIELRHLSGQTIQSWVSDGTVKVFYLMPGTYQFVETAAPEGYELAAPITFTIDEKGQIWVDSTLIVGDDPIVMIDNDKPITEAGQSIDFEETLPTEQGQSGSTTEVEDTKVPEVMIGGQGEIVEFEETLSTEQGQSSSATEVEDTKGPDVLIGGQGEIVEFEETLPTEHGQSGSTTEVEDSKPKISIHFDNEWPKEEKPQLPAVEKPKAKVSLPATGEAEHVLSTIVGAMILFLVSLWVFLKRKVSKA